MHSPDQVSEGFEVAVHKGLTFEAWQGLRSGDMTASELGILFGDYRYQTPLGLYHRKTSGVPPRETEEFRRGRIFEPAVAEMLGLEAPFLRLDRMSGSREHSYWRARSKDPFLRLGATMDYRGTCDRDDLGMWLDAREVMHPVWTLPDHRRPLRIAVEAKTVIEGAFRTHWRDGAPRGYTLQCAAQALLDGADLGLLVAMVVTPGLALSLHVWAVPRLLNVEQLICAKVSEFWQAIAAQRVPKARGEDNDSIGDMYEPERGLVADFTDPKWGAMAAQREENKAAMKVLRDENDTIEAAFKQHMGPATEGNLPGWKLNWRPNSKARPFILQPEK